MPEKPVPLTKEGLAKLEKELEYLRTVRRQEVATRIHQAKELASTQNNAEYEDAKNEQAFVEGRILTLEKIIANAEIINQEEAHRSKKVQLGSRVTVLTPKGTKETYTIVGSAEAQPREGRISNESPVGQGLIGKGVGDAVLIEAPAGTLRLTITDVS
ncbi:MAG: transcription elongation factor GreA [Dehalococcoidia bacterium]|nr:transcription elongation factor GreA [Dehalococcoidia bacterium]